MIIGEAFLLFQSAGLPAFFFLRPEVNHRRDPLLPEPCHFLIGQAPRCVASDISILPGRQDPCIQRRSKKGTVLAPPPSLRFLQDLIDQRTLLLGIGNPVLRILLRQPLLQLGIRSGILPVAVQIIPHIHIIVPIDRIIKHNMDMMCPGFLISAYIEILIRKILPPEDESLLFQLRIHPKYLIKIRDPDNDVNDWLCSDTPDRCAADMLYIDCDFLQDAFQLFYGLCRDHFPLRIMWFHRNHSTP